MVDFQDDEPYVVLALLKADESSQIHQPNVALVLSKAAHGN